MGHEQIQDAIRWGGGIRNLIKILCEGSKEAQEFAACTILSLAMHEKNRDFICDGGGIPALIKVLQNGSQGAQDAAGFALEVLSKSFGNNKTTDLIHKEGIISIIQTLREGD